MHRNDIQKVHTHTHTHTHTRTYTYTHTHTHTHKTICEQEDVRVLWKQAVRRDREVTANMPNIIIKNKTDKTTT
jgi:hypothetical protein